MSETARLLPRYKCHKEVWALKIDRIGYVLNDEEVTLHFADEGYEPYRVSLDWHKKHDPHAGGYLVIYDDGYRSFSPAKAFEEGYTRIEK